MKKQLSFFAIFLFFIHCTFADLTINIIQGVNKPYPIAVIPFGNEVTNMWEVPNGVSGVVAQDLTNSGRFSNLALSQMPAHPTSVANFNWQQWNSANTGIEYAVLGNIAPGTIPGTYTVTFSLLSLLSNQPLIGQQFANVPRTQLRLLAHQISDVIYQTITGKPGYFRTRLAYVEVFNATTEKGTWELVVSDYDGFNPHVLLKQHSEPIASPNWSPDGNQLAYVSYINNRQAIFTISLTTGQRRIIANFPGTNSAPAFSPDGTQMAMSLSGSDTTDSADLYVMNLKTRQLTRYTDFGNNTSPNWSPDGKTLSFNSDRGGSPQIYSLDLPTKAISRLSYTGINNYDPIYTPDGKNLIIMTQQSAGGPIQLASLNLASNAINIITSGQLDKSPSVAPNGDMIVYANYDSAHGILAETTLDGTVQIKLPATDGTVQSPAWSPFLN
ncbi:MAG: Tol-Pal system beta propeller repeat protein TolB [Gammaproteobacteria bacterium]|nr:Tol-Pal system beta propeller repeat protein TolB [Gammaproteobacteria bacterium]